MVMYQRAETLRVGNAVNGDEVSVRSEDDGVVENVPASEVKNRSMEKERQVSMEWHVGRWSPPTWSATM